ncbi:MAG: hypothetical protein QM650_08000 [Microlunatus sp.]
MWAMSAARVSAATTVRHAGRLILTVDETGRITSVADRRRPERPYLACVDLEPAVVNGRSGPWLDREVGLDEDEIEVTMRHRDSLDVQLRHGLSTGWMTRLLLVNSGATPLVLDRLPLRVQPAPDQLVSALAADSRICWAVQAADGHGPLLTARLTSGMVDRIEPEQFEFGGLRLAPGQRYVAQLRWELLATPRSVVAGPGRDVLLTRTVYEVREPVLLPEDPDAALVVPSEVGVDSLEEAEFSGREIFCHSTGRHPVELRSAEGDVCWQLSWVEPLATQLLTWAETILARPRTSAGVASIEDLPSAIVLQAALGAGGLEEVDDAADALDLVTARLLDDPESGRDAGPLALLYLLGEHGRTGDLDAFEAAVTLAETLLTGLDRTTPGLGLAMLRMVLAMAGSDLGPSAAGRVGSVVAQSVALVAQDGGQDGDAELELLLAVQPLLPPDPANHERISRLVRRLGAELGGGLPGQLLRPPPVTEHAYLAAVLQMLPEDGYPDITRSWGMPLTLLARQTTLQVLDRLTLDAGGEPADGCDLSQQTATAAAWLALVQRHG